jgi:putative toxin-antitoxin system antitoxin component (TIGR02293 family)
MALSVAEVTRIMGGDRALGRRVRTTEDLRHAVEAGLPLAVLAKVVQHVAGSDVAAQALKYRIVPKATLHRRKERLSLEESERLERMARVTALAEQVWEDEALAREFLASAQPQLGGETPLDLARTDLGARQVEELLMKLEYSLPA